MLLTMTLRKKGEEMNGKIKVGLWMVFICLLAISASCSQNEITKDYIEYDSMDDEYFGEEGFNYYKTAFTLKHPRGWESSWVSDSGVTAFLMASDDLEAVWSAQEHDNASIMIIVSTSFANELAGGVPIE